MKITKETVTTKTRKLSANWTVEQSQDLQAMSETLQKEIDREILDTLISTELENKCWIKVPVTKSRQICVQWLEENMTDEYLLLTNTAYFKSQADAMLYILRWS